MGWVAASGAALFGAALALALTAGEAAARSRALLVGASAYTGNDGITDLNGPRNDVTMMWRYLKSIGYADEDIVVLSDGLPQTADFPALKGAATYGAIVDELDALAAASYSAGDLVVFYYAGHGTTVPDLDPGEELLPEADGRDQVILPVDVRERLPDGSIENAIVDDELGRRLDAIRARGVDVWAVIDACHSGGGTRGGEVARYVDPAVLGITEALPPQAVSRGGPAPATFATAASEPGKGRLAAFFAVDAFNLAYEKKFDFADYQLPLAGETEDQRKLGVFSNYLHRALVSGRAKTFGELFQVVVAGIAADPVNASNPRPVAEGQLDMALPGSDGGRGMLRAVLDRGVLRIPAGVFDGFEEDAGVAIYDPEDPSRQLATGRIASATAANSVVRRLRWIDAETAAQGWTEPFPVRITDPVTSFVYRLGLPENLDALPGAERNRIRTLFSAALTVPEGDVDPGVQLAEPGAADINLATRVEDGRLWLFQPNALLVKDPQAFDKTLELALDVPDERLAAALRSTAWQFARAEKLLRLASNQSRKIDPAKLSFDASLFREGDRAADPRQACGRDQPLSPDEIARARPIGLSNAADVGNCDVIRVAALNTSSGDHYYVAGFYVDTRSGVWPMPLNGFEDDQSGCAWPLPPGAGRDLSFDVQVATWDPSQNGGRGGPLPSGRERVVVLAIKRDAAGQPPNLCALAQPSLADLKSMRSMRGTTNDLDRLLDGIVGGTRGQPNVLSRPKPERVEMGGYVLELSVRP